MRITVRWAVFILAAASGWIHPSEGVCQEVAAVSQLKQVLDVSQRRAQLEVEGAEPFHMVASFESFAGGPATGQVLGKGTLDELWVSPHRYRRSITLPDRTLVEVDNGTQTWRTGEWRLDQAVGLAIEAAVNPYSERPAISSWLSPVVSQQNATLDCIGSEPEITGASAETRLALTTFCLARGNHLIRLILRPNDIAIAFNDIQPFGKKFVARTIEVAASGRLLLRMHIDVLTAPGDLSALDATPPAEAQVVPFHRADQPYRSGELMHGQVLKTVAPIPTTTGFRGVVAMKVEIDTSGRVQQAEVVGSENQTIKNAALAAVRQWVWRVSYQGDKLVPQTTGVALDFGSYVK